MSSLSVSYPVSIIAETCPENQWSSAVILNAIEYAANIEFNRRIDMAGMSEGLRLSTRPEAVMRDITLRFLAGMQPAGNS